MKMQKKKNFEQLPKDSFFYNWTKKSFLSIEQKVRVPNSLVTFQCEDENFYRIFLRFNGNME